MSSSSASVTDEQINDLLSKLQATVKNIYILMMQASAAKVLQETCDYIRSLHREVDDLSERLSDLLADAEVNSAQAAIIRSFLN
ncbi:hypothetical protein ZIOFF_012197 [Zingiber officinale]|uniref:BHLH domain-containing protein n=1 Tax=Zingiber officinale TaxID=94328 RepID=A0A8J5HSC0_ZINOF|nr:hypothetical protein ZIOFF_012197 [Zingiber officinale]